MANLSNRNRDLVRGQLLRDIRSERAYAKAFVTERDSESIVAPAASAGETASAGRPMSPPPPVTG